MACVRKRRGKWVIDYRDRSGRRRWEAVKEQEIIDYDSEGKPYLKIIKENKKGADDLLAHRLREARGVTDNPNSPGETFREYATRWLDTYVRVYLKQATFNRYRIALEQHLFPAVLKEKGEDPVFGIEKEKELILGDVPVDEISRDMVRKLVSDLVQKPKHSMMSKKDKKRSGVDRRKDKDGVLSRDSVGLIHAVLRAILSSAVEDQKREDNPALRMGKIYKSKAEHRDDINPLTGEELTLFLESVKKTPKQHNSSSIFPFFLTLARTGMRLGEALGLEWGDIDFNGGFIEIRRSFTSGRIETPKSRETRRLDMSDQLASVLFNLLVLRKEETLKNGWGDVPPQVFISQDGAPLDGNNVRRRVFHPALERAGLKKIRIHDIRHSYATLLIHNKESLEYVRDQLGHHSIKVTVDVYGHPNPRGNRQAVNRLDDSSFEGRFQAEFRESGSKTVAETQFGKPSDSRKQLKKYGTLGRIRSADLRMGSSVKLFHIAYWTFILGANPLFLEK